MANIRMHATALRAAREPARSNHLNIFLVS